MVKFKYIRLDINTLAVLRDGLFVALIVGGRDTVILWIADTFEHYHVRSIEAGKKLVKQLFTQ